MHRKVSLTGVAILAVSALPPATRTVTIGTNVYQFCVPAGNVSADTNIAVVIAATIEGCIDNLVAAINGTVATPHPTLFKQDGITPALSRGTALVRATRVGSTMELVPAASAGGVPATVTASLALLSNSTASWPWSVANLQRPATGKIRLPPCHRWMVVNGSGGPVEVELLDGDSLSGIIQTVTTGVPGNVFCAPDPDVYVQLRGTTGAVCWILCMDDVNPAPERR